MPNPKQIIGGGDRTPEQIEKLKPESKHTERILVGNWLKHYQAYTIESESPDDFHLWTALSVLGSAVRRNVWLNQGTFMLYPNLYVVLVGPPGRVRKSTTIRLGRRLLLGLENINFGPDSVTREELIRRLGKISKQSNSAAMTIHSTEMSSLIDPSGIGMIQFLTDIFDGDFKWQYATKGQGHDVIVNPVVNMLAATTPSWIADGFPVSVIGHGFTSRIVWVYGKDKRWLRPFPKAPDPILVEQLTADLDHISRLEGDFQWGEGAKDTYKKIYGILDRTKPDDYRLEGFHNRKDIYVLKVAMLLSIAESDSLVMESRDITVATQILDSLEGSMALTFSAVGKYDHAADYERILAAVAEKGKEGMTSEAIHSQFYAVGDVVELSKILHMMTATGKVKRETLKGQPTTYTIV